MIDLLFQFELNDGAPVNVGKSNELFFQPRKRFVLNGRAWDAFV